MRHGEIGLRLSMPHVCVLRMRDRARPVRFMAASYVLAIKAVHPAVGPRIDASTVTGCEKRIGTMIEIPTRLQSDRFERNLLTSTIVTVPDGMRAGIAVKQIVETAVLLHDDHDVLDLVDAARRNRGG